MKHMRKLLMMLMCLLAALLLSACHVDKDPWPAGIETPVVTQVPAQTVPHATDVPLADQPANELVVETTQQPGGDEAPGING